MTHYLTIYDMDKDLLLSLDKYRNLTHDDTLVITINTVGGEMGVADALHTFLTLSKATKVCLLASLYEVHASLLDHMDYIYSSNPNTCMLASKNKTYPATCPLNTLQQIQAVLDKDPSCN